MSKEESSPGGLLSKVVRFVRNPTVNWTELDTLESDRESQYSKQMLKEMIERKRRNDFVRRREFDQLRKLRQRDALSGQRTADPAARPSFFQSSLTSPGERAVTIKKIDEIEAQMSMQWWRGKQGGDTAPLVPTLPAGLSPRNTGMAALSTAFAPTAPASMPLSLEPQAAAEPLFANDSMVIAGFGGATSPMLAPAEVEAHADASALASPAARSVVAVEMEAFVHEPDLEEAAILFANADYAGASACLLDVVAQHRNSQGESPLEIWMTLFDLYRATGQQEGFDTLAIEFAACFGRSAPLWFSIPEQLGLASSTPAAEAAAVRRDFSWNAPSTIGVQSVAALQASLARAASPWMLVWSRLTVIEEAAIRFANGDHAGAEAGLLGVLTQHAQDPPAQQLEIWMTLFDLYRATGQQERFDTLALDFAGRFSRSAPLWFSIPEQLGLASAAKTDAPAAPVRRDFSWNSPASLTAQSVATLRASLERAASPWTLVWSRLNAMEDAALPALEKEFARWAEQKVQIVFTGAEVLNALLETHTQSGDRAGNPAWWSLRMAALRCMNLPDEFEMVALDYCVTYEVSPPSWIAPRCSYSDVLPDGDASPPSAAAPLPDLLANPNWNAATEPAPLNMLADVGSSLAPAQPLPTLTGHIENDATAVLDALAEGARPGQPLVIPCERLIRIDFSAAGSVLNWAADQQAKGLDVRFQDLHRLVAVFFNVIGISEHAWVVPRKN